MDNGLIPRRYAKALFKFAMEHGSAKVVYEEMKEVIQSFEANPRLQKVLGNPFVSAEEKRAILKAAAGDKSENDYLGFIKLVTEQHREAYAWQMALAYRDIYRHENKISQVRITTAAALPSSEMERLRKMVSDSFKDRTLEFSEVVDSELIGGFTVDVDDTRMDASLRNELEQLRLNLINS